MTALGGGALIILALDTTVAAGSAAVVRDDVVLAEIVGDPALTHGQRLPGDLMRVLEAAAVRLDDVALLAVCAGPGSFTGLRVGIACMQGLAFSRGLKVVPVSSFEALGRHAIEHGADGALIAAWIDAQRGEVFASLCTPDAQQVLTAPSVAPPAATLEAWRSLIGDRAVLFTGHGALRYREPIAAALGSQARILDPAPPLAGTAGRIAAAAPHSAVLPHAVVPIYIRRPDAELARERSTR